VDHLKVAPWSASDTFAGRVPERKLEESDDSSFQDKAHEENEQPPSVHVLIAQLLTRTGAPVKCPINKATARRVLRPNGFADKTARVFEQVLAAVNEVHGLHEAPLTLRNVLQRMEEGKAILTEIQNSNETQILAHNAVELVNRAGRACAKTAVGILAQPSQHGKLSTKQLSELTDWSATYLKTTKKQVSQGDWGIYGTLSKPHQAAAALRVPLEEQVRGS
jgi:hypothetical protein